MSIHCIGKFTKLFGSLGHCLWSIEQTIKMQLDVEMKMPEHSHTSCVPQMNNPFVQKYYRPRSRGDNTFGSVRPPAHQSPLSRLVVSICLSILARSGRYWYLALPSTAKGPLKHSYTLKKHNRVYISRSIPNGWAFKMVVVPTGGAIAVDHAINVMMDWDTHTQIHNRHTHTLDEFKLVKTPPGRQGGCLFFWVYQCNVSKLMNLLRANLFISYECFDNRCSYTF